MQARGIRQLGIAAALLLLPPGCSKSGGTHDATIVVPAIALTLATGRPLTASTMAEIYPDFQLADPAVVPVPLIFGTGRVDNLDLSEPVILHRVGTAWKFVEMPALNHAEWVYAGAAPERGELWALLNSTPDSKGAGLYLFRSTDRGETWKTFSGVRPPTLAAQFVGFSMNAKGVGRITLHQDEDTDAAPRGLYAYASKDGGLTWTGPTFTPDDLVTADAPAYPTLFESLRALDPNGTFPAPPSPGGPAAGSPPSRGPRPATTTAPARGRGRGG